MVVTDAEALGIKRLQDAFFLAQEAYFDRKGFVDQFSATFKAFSPIPADRKAFLKETDRLYDLWHETFRGMAPSTESVLKLWKYYFATTVVPLRETHLGPVFPHH